MPCALMEARKDVKCPVVALHLIILGLGLPEDGARLAGAKPQQSPCLPQLPVLGPHTDPCGFGGFELMFSCLSSKHSYSASESFMTLYLVLWLSFQGNVGSGLFPEITKRLASPSEFTLQTCSAPPPSPPVRVLSTRGLKGQHNILKLNSSVPTGLCVLGAENISRLLKILGPGNLTWVPKE